MDKVPFTLVQCTSTVLSQISFCNIVLYHRKQVPNASRLLNREPSRPVNFNRPIVLTLSALQCLKLTKSQLYELVYQMIRRFLPVHFAPTIAENLLIRSKGLFIASQDSPNSPFNNLSNFSKDGFCHGCEVKDEQPLKLVLEESVNLHNTRTTIQSPFNYSLLNEALDFCSPFGGPNETAPVSKTVYLGIDWETSVMHLLYQYREEEFTKKLVLDVEEKLQANDVEKETSIYDCLESFVGSEKLSEEDGFKCSRCNVTRPMTKKFDFWTLPQVLVVHMKRFMFHASRYQKSHKMIRFPLRDLDLTKFAIGHAPKDQGEVGPKYDLVACICHVGTMHEGHYYSYVKNNGAWFLCNDTKCLVSLLPHSAKFLLARAWFLGHILSRCIHSFLPTTV
ncbi:ubiquitin carboxyl-terminal hydrolase [Cichlidogyrus casuarinus]|uniref:ubiquitinyl hydrolase 1 n=1 Tax=Cichlidogyrus casuarinus TaxID=1844966 RepID=A0ABD2PYS9_9PLAT